MSEDASSSRRRSGGYRLAPSLDQDAHSGRTPEMSERALLYDDTQDNSSTRSTPGLRFWCYALHVILVLLHLVLVGMLFTHPEHRLLVSISNTTAVIALKAFLQAFYTIYTAVLVFLTRRLAISAAMSKRQTLTAVHDISGAWGGIGASIGVLWQQTRITSAPLTILLTLVYLGSICGLHIVSSSVIQFEAFNNTVTSLVPSTSTWPSPSVNLSAVTWNMVSPLLNLWPLLSTAKGLNGSTLYDVPGPGYSYTGAIVNATSLTAECGLLSSLSTGVLNFTSTEVLYNVNISGLGDIELLVLEQVNLVSNIYLFDSKYMVANNSYAGFVTTTGMELGNISSEVAQATINSTIQGTAQGPFNISVTSYFIACTLNAETDSLYLPMEDGRVTQNVFLPNSSQPDFWTVWSPGPTTNLTQGFNSALNGLSFQPQLVTNYTLCQQVELPIPYVQCDEIMFSNEVYMNQLLGSQWAYEATSPPGPPSNITLGKKQMENAVAELAAAFIWIAGAAGVENGGFQQNSGESLTTEVVLQLRLSVNIIPVVIGLVASLILLTTIVWMFYGFFPVQSKRSVTSSGLLELIWLSAHSTFLQHSMKIAGTSIPDQLRLQGVKTEVCLSNLVEVPMCQQGEVLLETRTIPFKHKQEPSTQDKIFLYWLCFVLHGIFLVLHMVLVILLKDHPEHSIVMASDNPGVTTAIAISLQAFYTLYTAGLVFLTQKLAVSAMIIKWDYLTALHDVSQAWTGIGTGAYALWKQTKATSSIYTLLGVITYLGCVSILHIFSATVMQFTAFNSTLTTSIQTLVTWPNGTVISNKSWAGSNYIVIPSAMLANIETVGLVNNTIYDVVNATYPPNTNAIMNTTSLQVSCGLLPNITFSNNSDGSYPSFSFSIDGLGDGTVFVKPFQVAKNQIVSLISPVYSSSTSNNIYVYNPCPACDQYFFYMITTDVELDQSLSSNSMGLNVNITEEGNSSIIAYLAACSLSLQRGYANLDLQTNTLDPGPTWAVLRPWKLWSNGSEETLDLISALSTIFQFTDFGICPQYGFSACSIFASPSFSVQNTVSYTVTPNQIEQAIENSVAAMIWIGGKVGPSQGGFEWTTGESKATQEVTKWRLNINKGSVIIASIASLILFAIASWLIGISPKHIQSSTTITGISVLETLWIAAHSQTLYDCMKEVDEPSFNNLQEAGMFKVCLGNI